jgi:hypothetical protein
MTNKPFKSKSLNLKAKNYIQKVKGFGMWVIVLGFGFFVFSFFAHPASAASTADPVRTYFGARPLALGGAFTAVADDANAIFLNPAGIATFKRPEFVGTSRPLFFEETLYSAAGYAMPTDWGTFGIGIVDISAAGSLPTFRDPASGRITIDTSTEATNYDNNVILISYGKPVLEDLSLGLNLKFYNQALSGGAELHGYNLNADLGLLYRPLYISWLSLGVNYQNILGGAIKWNNASGIEDQLGNTIKIGSAFHLLGSKEAIFQIEKQKLMLSVDFDLIGTSVLSNQSSDLKIGAEYSPLSISGLVLRAGYDCNAGMGVGVGFEQSGFRFDYAYYQNSAVAGNNPHYFSLAYTVPPPARKFFEPQETSTPYLRVDKPKNKTITPELSLLIKGVAQQITQKGYWMPSTEAIISYEVDAAGSPEMVVKTIPVEIFRAISTEVRPIENLQDLRLNGNSMPYNKFGLFETMVKLEPALNVFTIEAVTTAEGTITSESFRVLRYIPFADIPENYWAIRPIAFISTFKIITGYPDDTFKPENPITRAELVTLLMKAKGAAAPTTEAPATAEAQFKDVNPDHWAAPYIYQAAQSGIVKGYQDGTFRPTHDLTRAEGVAILARWAELEAGRDIELTPFPDLPENFWANEFISKAKAAGMLKYLEKQNFNHKVPFTRCEATEILYRTPFIQEKVNRLWESGEVFSPTLNPSIETTSSSSIEATRPSSIEATSSLSVDAKP